MIKKDSLIRGEKIESQDINILIIEDEEIMGTILKKKLEKRGFNAFLLSKGIKAELDKGMIKDQSIDIVLMDLMMPEITGNEAVSYLRETYNKTELPIIVVTAKQESRDIVEALNNGANDFLQKPIDIDVAIARIQTAISIKVLAEEVLKSKEIETVASMVGTYNHEINNPLAIALGAFPDESDVLELTREQLAKKLVISRRGLNRIAEIVKKIDGLIHDSGENMEKVDYSDTEKIYKLS